MTHYLVMQDDTDYFSWAFQAVPKNDVRWYLNTLFVDSGIGIASDGHRIHRFQTRLDDGRYNKSRELDKSEESKHYPKTDQFFDTDKSEYIELELGNVEPSPYKGKEQQRINGTLFDRRYIREALNMGNPSRAYFADKKLLQLFWDDGRSAVVMPLRED